MFLKSYVCLGVIALLAIVSISIAWQLLTANYPTHSDVFFMGVEAGVLGTVLLVCLVLIGFFLYHLVVSPKRAMKIEDTSIRPFEPV
jgi:uncharacterized BrkB/YihY/UPF0761 family membrane protein